MTFRHIILTNPMLSAVFTRDIANIVLEQNYDNYLFYVLKSYISNNDVYVYVSRPVSYQLIKVKVTRIVHGERCTARLSPNKLMLDMDGDVIYVSAKLSIKERILSDIEKFKNEIKDIVYKIKTKVK